MVDPQWHTCIWYWGYKWNLHTVCWDAVGYEWSGAQPLFTLGLLMFALSLVDFLSLLLSPSIDIKTFYFCQKYHLKNTYKIFKKFHAGLKFEWGLWDLCWLSCERLRYKVFTQGQFWPSGIVICVCVRVRVCVSLCVNHLLVRVITWDPFKLGSPKMQKTLVKVPIVLGGNWPWPSRSNLTSKSEFTPFWACPDHNSSPIQVRITKFGPEV